MNSTKFGKVAESLRQYRRADLSDFEEDLGAKPVDALYVDPKPNDEILNSMLSGNTTFILGRKGTGKSTVFSRAQSEIRKDSSKLSIYIDVKSLYGLIKESEVVATDIQVEMISDNMLNEHLFRKEFLKKVLNDCISELEKSCESLPIWDSIVGNKKKSIQKVIEDLRKLQKEINEKLLTKQELPILQTLSTSSLLRMKASKEEKVSGSSKIGMNPIGLSGSVQVEVSALDGELRDENIYEKYSEALLRSFPFSDFIDRIKCLLSQLGLKRLVIFFDDFSEISWFDQRVFVDVILTPLNNSSNESIKLKVAGYPGRVYFGKIDPGKVDTIDLDFVELYKNTSISKMEDFAVSYTERLLSHRFNAFGLNIFDYFVKSSFSESVKVIFQATFNAPRLMGFILKHCHLDQISYGKKITPASVRLASEKYYSEVVSKYFDRYNRFALEPFEYKIERQTQKELLEEICLTSKKVKRDIVNGSIGGEFFKGISNPSASHFSISSRLEDLLVSLEFNYLLTRYSKMSDKSGGDIYIYALNHGLCESENIRWGTIENHPEEHKYYTQRCFNYNSVLHNFVNKRKIIKCDLCGNEFPFETKDMFEFCKWVCTECFKGKCSVVQCNEEYKDLLIERNNELRLEMIEIEILEVLHQENRVMRAGEIASFMDATYQLIGKRTSKLKGLGLVEKKKENGAPINRITEKAIKVYFN